MLPCRPLCIHAFQFFPQRREYYILRDLLYMPQILKNGITLPYLELQDVTELSGRNL